MGVVKTAFGDPTHDGAEGEAHVYRASFDTDGSGDGSTAVSYDESVDSDDPIVIATADADGDLYVSSKGSSQATVNIVGSSTTEDTVNVSVLVVG